MNRAHLADPVKTVRTGPGFDFEGDPLHALEKELEPYRYAKLNQVPTFTGECNQHADVHRRALE